MVNNNDFCSTRKLTPECYPYVCGMRNVVTTTERHDICITQSIVGIQGVGLTVIGEERKPDFSVDFTVVSSNGKESLYSSLHGGL